MRALWGTCLLVGASADVDLVGTGRDYDADADVSEICSVGHSLRYLDRAQGYDTADEWSRVIASMVSLPAARDRAISTYLAANYRHKPSKAPTLIEGDTNIVIDEWLTPSLGQRTRDPIEAPNGDIWWTGMWASLVGRLDPATGAMQEFLLPSAARPHSIVPDRDGFIWYTGVFNS